MNLYSEDTHPVSESEYDEVMSLMAEDFDGYGQWSAELERSPSIENFTVENGKVRHKAEPKSLGRIGGFEL